MPFVRVRPDPCGERDNQGNRDELSLADKIEPVYITTYTFEGLTPYLPFPANVITANLWLFSSGIPGLPSPFRDLADRSTRSIDP